MSKTTLREIINNIDFNNKQLQSDPDWQELANIFSINDLWWSDDTRLKSYFIKVHYCTDTFVGLKAYFLDNEFVALSDQAGRKYDEDFSFVSKESSEKVRNYLISLVNNDDKIFSIDIFNDLDEEIESTYKIEYNTQILHKFAYYKGEKVEIIKTNFQNEGFNSPNYFHTVLIKYKNKKVFVNCKELDFPYNTLN